MSAQVSAQIISMMADVGLVVDTLIVDGNIHRAPVSGKKGKPGWYVATEINGKIFGAYGDWSTNETHKFSNNEKGPSNLTKEEVAINKMIAEKTRKKREELQKQAAQDSLELWEASEPAREDHPYLLNKQIDPYGARLEKATGALLVNFKDAKGNHTTLQRIWAKSQIGKDEPDKRFFPCAKKQGSCHVIEGSNSKIYIVEGFATGVTVHENTQAKVLVAGDSGNILPVAKMARKVFGDLKNPANIIIAADNDYKKENNVGLEKAREAAKAIGAELVYPEGIEGTDFNDMAAEKGRAAVRQFFDNEKPLSTFTSVKKVMENDYPAIKWAVEGIIPEGLTILAGRPKFGKSWLMLGLSYAIATGGQAWSFGETQKGTVHYLALEDSERRIKDRILNMEGYFDTYPDNLFIYTDFPRIGEGFVREVGRILVEHPDTAVIIVDTLQKIRPMSNGGKRNLYQAEYEDYERLQKFSIKHGVPIICVHHTRKGSPGRITNPMDEMSGSSGIQGVADTLIVCVRDGNTGVMHVTGREVNEEDYPLEFIKSNMTWQLSPPEAQQIDTSGMMLSDFFKTHAEITAKQAAETFNLNERRAREKLANFVDIGKLIISRTEGRKKFFSPTEIF